MQLLWMQTMLNVTVNKLSRKVFHFSWFKIGKKLSQLDDFTWEKFQVFDIWILTSFVIDGINQVLYIFSMQTEHNI